MGRPPAPSALALSLVLCAIISLWAVVITRPPPATASPALSLPTGLLFTAVLSSLSWLLFAEPGCLPRHPLSGDALAARVSSALQAMPPLSARVLWLGEAGVARFCVTCLLWRPPRAHHCRSCDACVLEFDHHCGVLGVCIGERNQAAFLWLLSSGAAALVLTLCTSISAAVAAVRGSGEDTQSAASWWHGEGAALWSLGGVLAAVTLLAILCGCARRCGCGVVIGAVTGGCVLLVAYARTGAGAGAGAPAILLAAVSAALLPTLTAFACAQACGAARGVSTKVRLRSETQLRSETRANGHAVVGSTVEGDTAAGGASAAVGRGSAGTEGSRELQSGGELLLSPAPSRARAAVASTAVALRRLAQVMCSLPPRSLLLPCGGDESRLSTAAPHALESLGSVLALALRDAARNDEALAAALAELADGSRACEGGVRGARISTNPTPERMVFMLGCDEGGDSEEGVH